MILKKDMKQDMKQDALDFVEKLIYLYFVKRDISALLEYMQDSTSWIGTGEGELSRNLQEAQIALAGELYEYSGNFTITDKQLEFIPLAKNNCIVYGILHAVPSDNLLSDEHLRLSIVLEQSRTGLKLVHMHFSHADLVQERGHYFVRQAARTDNQSLRQELNIKEKQLANLTKNIPGGAHQCANDSSMTLLSMSDGFLTMFGYTKEEIEQLFDSKFINMIYPDDREGMLKSVYEQLCHGLELELEYRVLCKNGDPIWVLDKGRLIDDGNENECFYCLLIDITTRKREQEELRLSLERHQLIMDQTTDIIFEWDIVHDTLIFSSNWKKKFGYSAIDSQISDRIPLSSNIHKDDMSAFLKIMKDTAAGIPYSETEFRIKDISGHYNWCRIRATNQYNSDGRPIKAVGVITDIDEEKKHKQLLISQAQCDLLTGIYNKATISELIKQRVEGVIPDKYLSGYQALFIIDLDHFKYINDTYGHLCGDDVLANVSAALKRSIRSTDLVGRVGGDEFIVYFPEITDEAAVKQKAECILEAVRAIKTANSTEQISCSIGSVILPHGSVDYHMLYQCADYALYEQKNNGRDGVSFISAADGLDDLVNLLSISAAGQDLTFKLADKLSRFIERVKNKIDK